MDYQRPASRMVDFIYKKRAIEGYPIVMDSTFSSIGVRRSFDLALKAGYQSSTELRLFWSGLRVGFTSQPALHKVPLEVLKTNFFQEPETHWTYARLGNMQAYLHSMFIIDGKDPENDGQFKVVDYTPIRDPAKKLDYLHIAAILFRRLAI